MAGREHLRATVPRGYFSAMGREPPSEGKGTRVYLSSGILEGQFTQLRSSSSESSADYSNHSWTQRMCKRQMASHEDGVL